MGDPDSPDFARVSISGRAVLKKRVLSGNREISNLILEGSRLYLYRYWEYEKRLIDTLKERTQNDYTAGDDKFLTDGLARLFPVVCKTNWRKDSSTFTTLKRFCVISGGPGTGKTFTIAKILALLLEYE